MEQIQSIYHKIDKNKITGTLKISHKFRQYLKYNKHQKTDYKKIYLFIKK